MLDNNVNLVKKIFDYVEYKFEVSDMAISLNDKQNYLKYCYGIPFYENRDVELLTYMIRLLTFGDDNEEITSLEINKVYKYKITLGENIEIFLFGVRTSSLRRSCKLQMRGKGCREFESRGGNYGNLFSILNAFGCKASRIDDTWDLFTDKYFTIDKIEKYLKNNLYVGLCDTWSQAHGYGKNGITCKMLHIGRITSDVSITVYDKNLERIADNDVSDKEFWLRFEVHYKNSRAENFVDAYLEEFVKNGNVQFESEYLYYVIDFKTEKGNNEIKKRSTAKWWLDFLEVVKKRPFEKGEIASLTLETKKSYLERSVMKTLGLVYFSFENKEDFFDWISRCIYDATYNCDSNDKTYLSILNKYFENQKKPQISLNDIKEKRINLLKK